MAPVNLPPQSSLINSSIQMQLNNAVAAASLVLKETQKERDRDKDEVFYVRKRLVNPYGQVNEVSALGEKQEINDANKDIDDQQRNTQYRREIQNFKPRVAYQDQSYRNRKLVQINTPFPMPESMGRLLDRKV